MQPDNNLVLYRRIGGGPHDWCPTWSTGTARPMVDVKAVMQTDGNFVLYTGSVAIWASNTAGHPGAVLAVQDDGNLVVYDSNGSPIWATGTSGQ